MLNSSKTTELPTPAGCAERTKAAAREVQVTPASAQRSLVPTAGAEGGTEKDKAGCRTTALKSNKSSLAEARAHGTRQAKAKQRRHAANSAPRNPHSAEDPSSSDLEQPFETS